eukprot:m.662234 g.662234  ORF g.662234 m.662234 type:complete len:75 (-) comp22738_c1_seq2:518-742(-)
MNIVVNDISLKYSQRGIALVLDLLTLADMNKMEWSAEVYVTAAMDGMNGVPSRPDGRDHSRLCGAAGACLNAEA